MPLYLLRGSVDVVMEYLIYLQQWCKCICKVDDKELPHRYFMSTSSVSGPPSALYILLSMGDMSDCFMDWRTSTTEDR